jgi:hypothetical protein
LWMEHGTCTTKIWRQISFFCDALCDATVRSITSINTFFRHHHCNNSKERPHPFPRNKHIYSYRDKPIWTHKALTRPPKRRNSNVLSKISLLQDLTQPSLISSSWPRRSSTSSVSILHFPCVVCVLWTSSDTFHLSHIYRAYASTTGHQLNCLFLKGS